MQSLRTKSAGFTLAALIGFAANSVLCRLALAQGSIDPASFTAVRLASGACMLAILARVMGPKLAAGRSPQFGASWLSALALFVYAGAFSFAYVQLPAGTGALILFGLVQLTMVTWGLLRGERLGALQCLGFALAIVGLVGLTAPGISAPEPLAALTMCLAGVAWGVYSIRGLGSPNPIGANASNFARTLPLAAALLLLAPGSKPMQASGFWLALASGALASGLAYSLWYAALRSLKSTQAAALQLSVPVLAALGGIVLLEEALETRLLLTGTAILCGVALAVRR